MLKQITVFIENRPGRLADVTGCLADEGINIHALSIADTTDFGVLRMIVSDPRKAKTALRERGFMVKTAEVAAVALGHKPGSLHKILETLNAAGISIEYVYAFTSRHRDHDAIVILSAGNPAPMLEKIKAAGFTALDETLLDELNKG
ncbi:MAG TPA: hypothetical protein DEQ02_07405 [Ruminococcaceae bacterium]|nr:hypothetical protein [Oscillospiraceae bacterium]